MRQLSFVIQDYITMYSISRLFIIASWTHCEVVTVHILESNVLNYLFCHSPFFTFFIIAKIRNKTNGFETSFCDVRLFFFWSYKKKRITHMTG